MNALTIIWIALPLFIGFSIYLLPSICRYLALGVAIVSLVYGLKTSSLSAALDFNLLDNFGVILLIDNLSGFFILTNALVTLGVILYCWYSDKTSFFYTQVIILHGSVNAAFICADFISLYVALEVISIAAFLLIAYPRSDRSIWVALRYLFVSNTAMLFYLVGTVLVYQAHHSFSFEGLKGAPLEAVALIFLGLLAKGGIFIVGLWLPLTHSESETPVSAMLSGVVVKAAIYPLVRCTLMVPEVDPIVRIFGVGTALLGVIYAIFEQDAKRMLAFSTVSQLGFILAAPEVGGFYALTHGLVKSSLFLMAGALPSLNLRELKNKPMNTAIWIPLVIASFSISGFPLLSGFGAKVLTMKNLLPWQVLVMNVAALGTATAFAKFIFLPHTKEGGRKIKRGFWPAIALLLSGLFIANGVYYQAYTLTNIIKPLATIFLAWLTYIFIVERMVIKLPRVAEQLEHLIGMMSLILIFVFWLLLGSQISIS
ncbi:cation:proton antiporter [Crocosphaera watsonii]|uniref:NADH dehydrogenase subunit 4 n=1 Tax=Crocosphaera watsonii WH 8502 TaxID=423474 RepID=T2ICE9_CROWT|nr:cation:proton antiporter [Crocosphaera watsonii]CCQ50492.1 NADH dehydrogenase subunit 4 [Crocosphaera watsonii WH 8502]